MQTHFDPHFNCGGKELIAGTSPARGSRANLARFRNRGNRRRRETEAPGADNRRKKGLRRQADEQPPLSDQPAQPCEFRFNPATDSDLKPAGIPI